MAVLLIALSDRSPGRANITQRTIEMRFRGRGSQAASCSLAYGVCKDFPRPTANNQPTSIGPQRGIKDSRQAGLDMTVHIRKRMRSDGGFLRVTQSDMTRVFPRSLTCLIRHPTHNVDKGNKKHEGHPRTSDILQSTRERFVATSLPDGAMGARLNRNDSPSAFGACRNHRPELCVDACRRVPWASS